MDTKATPKYKLQDLIDMALFQNLQDRLNEIYSFPSAIIDNDGNVLTATAWQDICTQFYRKNSGAEKECIKSDKYIISHLHEANPAVSYQCPHGLIDNATPIIVDGVHYGNFFTGQFFLEKPDMNFYREQARKYGFDENAFISAVNKVPIWTREQLNSYLFFIKGLIAIISESALKNLKEIESRKQIELSEKRISAVIRTTKDGFCIVSTDGLIIDANEAYVNMTGYSVDELRQMHISDLDSIDTKADITARIKRLMASGSGLFETQHKRKDGSLFDVEVSITCLPAENAQIVCFCRDITERKRVEEGLRETRELFELFMFHSPIYSFIKEVSATESRVLQASDSFKTLIGVSGSDIRGKTMQELFPADFAAKITADDQNVVASKKVLKLDEELNGRFFTTIKFPIVQGGRTLLAGYTIDITERKRMEEKLREKDIQFRKLSANVPDLIFQFTRRPDGSYCVPIASEGIKNIFGCTPEDVLEDFTPIGKVIYPDDAARVISDIEYSAKHLTYFTCEFRVQIPGRPIQWILSRSVPEKLPDGSITWFGFNADITERKQAEEALRESESRFRQLADSTFEAIAIHENGRLLDVNASFCRMFDYDRAEVIGMPVLELIAPEYKDRILENIRIGYDKPYENGIVRKDGVIVLVETIGRPIQYEGRLVRVTALRDITERKKAEQALRESEARYRFISENTDDVIWTWSFKKNKFTFVSPSVQKLRGYTPEEVMNQTMADALTPESLDAITHVLKQGIAARKRGDTTMYKSVALVDQQCKNGSVVATEAATTVVFDRNGQPVEIIGISRDITERKRSEEVIRTSEERLSAFMNSASDSFYLLDSGLNFIKINNRGLEIIGKTREEVIGKNIAEIVPDVKNSGRHEKHLEVIRTGKPYTIENLIPHPKFGNLHIVLTSFKVGDGLGVIAHDITERKRMEEELQKVQKLDALGLLAGGIAHDFNNLMGGIFGYIDMAKEESTEKKVTQYLTKAVNTIDRARGLTQQLLTFAKGGTPIKKIDALFPVIKETAQFALSGSNVSSSFDVSENLWPCDFDKNQIGQVIDNIVINAKQAMSGGGAVEITARNTVISENEHPSLAAGTYVKLSIRDYGIGIPKNVLPRIFDPFYTTKATGHGLGLATCYSIVTRHGGCIDVESEPGAGSTFHVFLPAVKDSSPFTTEKTAALHKGKGFFLVMDDQEVMRETIGDMLKSLGYTPVLKENGQEAINFVSAESKADRKIAGMIFDLTIPGGKGGKEAIGEIRKLTACEKTPAFVTSGYAEDPVMANPGEYGFTASICKPFRKAELSEMLNIFMCPKK